MGSHKRNMHHTLHPLVSPQQLMANCPPVTNEISQQLQVYRDRISDILSGQSDRLLVVVGPCSIHNTVDAVAYALKLKQLRTELADQLEIVMRVYFEKPRTTIGWKGLINDPYLDGSFHINDGLQMARNLLHEINRIGLPAACEFLDMVTPYYIMDLVAWAAIGARTVESQSHRELASSLPMPVGFKNGTDGNIEIAIDAVRAVQTPHSMLSIMADGQICIRETQGNPDGHIILRGGPQSNYSQHHVQQAVSSLQKFSLPPRLMVDCSHGNSLKQYQRQSLVCADLCQQIQGGEAAIMGVMIESNLVAGSQGIDSGQPLVPGQSITDACIGWEETEHLLNQLAAAVATRQQNLP